MRGVHVGLRSERVRFEFQKHRHEADPEKIEFLMALGETQLDNIRCAHITDTSRGGRQTEGLTVSAVDATGQPAAACASACAPERPAGASKGLQTTTYCLEVVSNKL